MSAFRGETEHVGKLIGVRRQSRDETDNRCREKQDQGRTERALLGRPLVTDSTAGFEGTPPGPRGKITDPLRRFRGEIATNEDIFVAGEPGRLVGAETTATSEANPCETDHHFSAALG